MKQWNGISWENRTVILNGEDNNSRDGMPIWCKLSNGEYIMAIESTHLRNSFFRKRSFVIQLYSSENGTQWNKINDVYIPANRRKSEYAGAPYVVQLPDGRLCVSFQTDENELTDNKDKQPARVITTNKAYDGKLNRFSFTKPFAPFGEDGESFGTVC